MDEYEPRFSTFIICPNQRDKHFSGLYYKCFKIVIYDHNDSGQYYKTTIVIVFDDPS